MKGKVCVITGANSGVGKEMARELARMGATVVMVCRSKKLGEDARQEIIEETKNKDIHLMLADLASLNVVRRFAEDFKKRFACLHVLINNAAIWPIEREVSKDGYELQFAVSYLSHFLLTNQLLDIIRKSAPSRIINVTSGIHFRGKINFKDLQSERRYRNLAAYAQSKLAMVLFTYELDRRLKGTGVTANTFTPGMSPTRLGRNMSRFANWFLKQVGRPPEEAARTGVYLASSPEVEGVSGKYYADCREKKSSKSSYDKDLAKRLWDVSEDLTR